MFVRFLFVIAICLSISCGKLQFPRNSQVALPESEEESSGHGDNHDHDEEDSGDSGDGGGVVPPPKGDGGTGGGGAPSRVTFTVTAGMGFGSEPYNTKANPIVVKVGGVINFVNNSGVDLIIHCGGNGQMNHWDQGDANYPKLATGASRDYPVKGGAYDPANDSGPNRCYRHNGNQAMNGLFIKVVP